MLTNKRLFFCGAKGVFNREYVIKKEVDLKDIVFVRGDIGKTMLGVTDNSWLIMKPKKEEEWNITFSVILWVCLISIWHKHSQWSKLVIGLIQFS